MGPEQILSAVLAKDLSHQRHVPRRQHDILQPPRRIANGQKREASLPILMNAGGQPLESGRGRCGGAAVQDSLQVVGEQVVVLLPFGGDHLLRDTPEDLKITRRA